MNDKLVWIAYLNMQDNIVLIARASDHVAEGTQVLVPYHCVRKMFPEMVWREGLYRILNPMDYPILARKVQAQYEKVISLRGL